MLSPLRSNFSGLAVCTILIAMAIATKTTAQKATEAESKATVCTFEDGKQISARYIPVPLARKEGPSPGKVWTPGDSAMALFTETDLTLSNTSIPTGAYTMYLIPGKKVWTLVVSRNLKMDAPYEEREDLVRAPMETGTLDSAEDKLSVFSAIPVQSGVRSTSITAKRESGPNLCRSDCHEGR